MDNQPPAGRPWFRLASLSRPEAPQQAQPPQPPAGPRIRPPAFPAISPAVAAPPAQAQPTPPPPPPQPQPPPPRSITPLTAPAATPPPSRSPAPSPTPPESPRVIRSSTPTPPRSPRTSQLQPTTTVMPNPEPEPERKPLTASQTKSITTVQEGSNKNGNESMNTTTNGEQRKNGGASEPRLVTIQSDTRAPPPSPQTENRGSTLWNGKPPSPARRKNEAEMGVITISGKNVGAHMELGSLYDQRQTGKQQQYVRSGLSSSGQANESGSDDGELEDGCEIIVQPKTKPMTILVNSNVQSVNNSMLLNSSCTLRSPSVHVTLNHRRRPKSTHRTRP